MRILSVSPSVVTIVQSSHALVWFKESRSTLFVAILAQAVSCSSVDDGSDLPNSVSFASHVFEFRFSQWFRPRCRRNRRTVQRASGMCWIHSCGIHRFRKSCQDHQWSRGSCHFQNYQCRTHRQYPLCQDGFVCRDGTESQRPSLHAGARLKQMLLFRRFWLIKMFVLYRNRLMTLQDPTAQDHLKTTGTQDADLILSRTWMMKKCTKWSLTSVSMWTNPRWSVYYAR